jgi:phage shock protein E
LLILLVPGLLWMVSCTSQSRTKAEVVRPEAAVRAKVLDVRTPEEFASGHISGAINVPVTEIEQKIASVAPDKTTPLMIHCRSGGRSARAKTALEKLGYINVTDLGSLAHAREVVEGK